MTYISGLCNIGCHEATTPRNFRGSPLPTCARTSEQCGCSCHTELDEMFKMSGMDRITVDKSSYVPYHGDFVMPTPEELAESRRLSDSVLAVSREESPDPSLVPVTIVRTFAEPKSGRAAPGELEQQVNKVCKDWVIENDTPICTPAYISERIALEYGIKAPSTGAISAVFDRFVAVGYADCQRKPIRFVGFTADGIARGLDGCKQRAKRARVSR